MNIPKIDVDTGKLMGFYFFGEGIILCSGAIAVGATGTTVYLGAFLMCVGCILLSTRFEKA